MHILTHGHKSLFGILLGPHMVWQIGPLVLTVHRWKGVTIGDSTYCSAHTQQTAYMRVCCTHQLPCMPMVFHSRCRRLHEATACNQI